MRFAAVVFLALLLLPAGAYAGPLEDGMAAMDRPDYQTALKLLQPLADQGNAKAQFWVGVLYQGGQMDAHAQWTVKRDYAEAARWYRKSADQGYSRAQGSLSSMYAFGEGVTKDWAEAYFWNKLAAAAGEEHSVEESSTIAAQLTPEQKDAVEKRVEEWKPTIVQAICLSYADETTLTGKLEAITFPGPPNYESIARGDRAEHDMFLTLSSPVCVDADSDSRQKGTNVAIAKLTMLQLAANPQTPLYNNIIKMIGHEANISGKLFGKVTGHHHTPVLIFVDDASLHE